jgi:hypothetical protein
MTELHTALQDIKDKGNWLVIVRPKIFEAKRLPIESCKDIVLNSMVSLRPYNYPYYYGDSVSYQTDYVQCISDIRPDMGATKPPMSIWRMYQSGQFVHRFSCVEDYWEVSAGKNVLSATSTLFIVTEIYEFASRIAESNNIFDNGLTIKIGLHNMRNRSLVEVMSGELYEDRLRHLYYRCKDNDVVHQKELTLSDLIHTSKELAVDHTLFILNKFEWSSASYLQEQQKKLFRIKKTKERFSDYPVSVDDPSKDKTIFRDRLMQEVCRRYKYLRRNTDSYEFMFSIEDIRKPGMMGFEQPYFIQKIPELQEEDGYIEMISGGKIRLTTRGMQYCDGLS